MSYFKKNSMQTHKKSAKDGFSLIQLSIVLIIGGLVVASSLPGGGVGDDLSKEKITLDRMEKIETAMQAFMSANQRRPYPSDLTAAFSAAAYGVELAAPSDYSSVPTTHFTTAASGNITVTTTANNPLVTITSGTTATISSALTNGWMISGTSIPTYSWVEFINSTTTFTMNNNAASATAAAGITDLKLRNPLVAGGVPTRSLGLPDEYGIDGYGRRIVYMVDQRVTRAEGCTALQNNHLLGALALSNSSTFSTGTYDYTMWALLSYGKDGQGAVGIQGSALNSRIQTGNANASSLSNAFYDSAEATSYAPLGLVNKLATNTYTSGALDQFDDIVWVAERTKNTCALGASFSYRDFRISGGGTTDGSYSAATFADVNGDTWPDMVIGVPDATGGGLVRVIFGKKYGWPDPAGSTTSYDSSTALDGKTGFTITHNLTGLTNFGATIATGNINGDNYNDLVICGQNTDVSGTTVCAVVYGKASWSSSLAITSGFASASNGFLINQSTQPYFSAPPHVSVGDINSNGGTTVTPVTRYDDISLAFYDTTATASWVQALIYGGTLSSDVTLSSAMTGSGNTYIKVATPSATYPMISYGNNASTSTDVNKRLSAICDVNRDGYKDLLFPAVSTSYKQIIYLKLGAGSSAAASSSTNWPTDRLIDPSADASILRFSFDTKAAATSPNYDIDAIACKDVDSDNYEDILFYIRANSGSPAQEYVYMYPGSAAPATTNLDSGTPYKFFLDLTASRPSWQDSSSIPQINFGDINGDAATDIIISRSGDDPYINAPFSLDDDMAGGSSPRNNAGTVYVINQPSTCYSSTCWDTTPASAITFHTSKNYSISGGIDDGSGTDMVSVEAVGDMNKDGRDDLLISTRESPTGAYLVFGKASFPSSYDLHCTRSTGAAHCPTQINTR